VAGHGAYTHLSMYHAAVVARDVLGEDGPLAEHHAVPHTTFTDPEVAGVGLTEAAARRAGLDVRVGHTDLAASSRGYTHGPGAEGLVKVVEDTDAGVLVGATVVGPYAGEILSMLTLAVHARIPVATLRSMIYAYPTFHRAVESALADL
jgi:pyruvate/2-oxoglutarate dehydrogenase complex dihydrolipoamide dehydrogenase (E3) component